MNPAKKKFTKKFKSSSYLHEKSRIIWWDGMNGVGRSIKRVFQFFFILRYIKHYTDTNSI